VRGDVTVRTLRELGEISSIREVWRSFQDHPWADVDYYVEVLARKAEFIRPHVLVLEREGLPIALIAGVVRRDFLPWQIGFLALGRSRARVLRIGGGAVMGESSDDVARVVARELQDALGRGEADVAYLHQIDSQSALLRRLEHVPGLARDRFSRAVGGWVLDLPESYDAYLESRTKGVRRHLKRYAGVLERKLGRDFSIVCHRGQGDMERLIRDSETVARLTYHRRMGVGFDDTDSTRQVFAHAMAAGWLRGYVMYVKERPIAFWHGLVYGKTFYTRDTGYDPEFGELRPGNYLMNRIIEEHCRTRETERFDYGLMDLDYKRNFGSRRYERSSIYLFSRRPRGLFLSTMRAASGTADRAARLLLGARAPKWTRKLRSIGRGPSARHAHDADRSAEHPLEEATGKEEGRD
jgi:hypothetical protein